MSSNNIKCKKCRNILVENSAEILINAHGLKIQQQNQQHEKCDSLKDDKILYLKEDNIPKWISEIVEEEGWTKGKLNCSQCNNRIGSFDFISGLKCICTDKVLPSVHLIKSKVDYVVF